MTCGSGLGCVSALSAIVTSSKYTGARSESPSISVDFWHSSLLALYVNYSTGESPDNRALSHVLAEKPIMCLPASIV